MMMDLLLLIMLKQFQNMQVTLIILITLHLEEKSSLVIIKEKNPYGLVNTLVD